MSSYLNREISEWNTTDLSKWLLDNKYPGISELCTNNSISGYDLFYITDDILKNELGLNSFHERKVTMKLIKKLIYEHLKLNIINSNGDNVILTLDNNPETSLGDLSEYIGRMFNIEPKDILYKDTSKTEVLSPTLKIVELLILYPRLYKTLNVFNMKDYHQNSENENDNNENGENENLESKGNEYMNNMNNINNNMNNNNNSMREGNSMNDSDYQKSNLVGNNNKNRNIKMNFDYQINRNMNDDKMNKDKYTMEDTDENNNNNRIIYSDKNNNKDIIYNEEYDMRNKDEQRYHRRDKNINMNMDENTPNNENTDENYNKSNWEMNNKIKYKTRGNYMDRDNNDDKDGFIRDNNNKGYTSYRNRKLNFNEKPYQDGYCKQYKNYEKKENYYDN
jgi:hypothetical protein